jgi:hypothetical protein
MSKADGQNYAEYAVLEGGSEGRLVNRIVHNASDRKAKAAQQKIEKCKGEALDLIKGTEQVGVDGQVCAYK